MSIENITAESYSKISETLQKMEYYQEAVNEFSSGADYFLVALAYQESYTIITHEAKSGNNTKSQIKIPNVCKQLEVECIDISDFLRREKVKFILGK